MVKTLSRQASLIIKTDRFCKRRDRHHAKYKRKRTVAFHTAFFTRPRSTRKTVLERMRGGLSPGCTKGSAHMHMRVLAFPLRCVQLHLQSQKRQRDATADWGCCSSTPRLNYSSPPPSPLQTTIDAGVRHQGLLGRTSEERQAAESKYVVLGDPA